MNEHALAIVEEQMLQQDALMTQLAQEFDNGRLLRLLARLVKVSEGSQTSLDPSWSETGKLPTSCSGSVMQCWILKRPVQGPLLVMYLTCCLFAHTVAKSVCSVL